MDTSRSRKEILFIINPISGTQSKDKIVSLIQQHVDFSRFEFNAIITQYQGHATELAQAAVRQGVDYVVAVGGDGTVNEVARALVHSETALGIVPMGSGNGLARHLGLPINVIKALQRIGQERNMLIDSCTLNDIPFFCTAGVGFDAQVGYLFAQQSKRGFSTYVRTAIEAFFSFKPSPYSLTVGGKTQHKSAFSVTFANASQYGNNAYIAPQADINDGILDVSLIRPFPLLAMLAIATRLFAKTLDKSRYVDIIRTKEIHVQGNGPLRIHLDGDSLETGNSLTVKIKPLSLKVLI